MGNKLRKRFAICSLCVILFGSPSTAYAYTVAEAQEALVNYAKDFAANGPATHYYVDDWASENSERARAYLRDEKCGNSAHEDGMGMDCVGWVSYAIHHCYGIGSSTSFSYFATPQNGAYSPFTQISTSYSEGNAQPGDILISDHHVMIYVGGNSVVECINGGVQLNANFCSGGYNSDVTSLARLSDASSITTLVDKYNGTGLSASSSSASGTSVNYSNFFFNGIPDGKYSVASKKSILEIIVDTISNIFSFIVGLIAYIFRVIAISIVSIFDRLLNNMVKNIVEPAEVTLQESGLSSTNADDPESENRSITIQSMVFNTLDIFDVNVFEGEE